MLEEFRGKNESLIYMEAFELDLNSIGLRKEKNIYIFPTKSEVLGKISVGREDNKPEYVALHLGGD